MAEVDNFANIIVPVPVPELFTYSVPDKLKGRVHVGSQVVVSFGDRKFHTGIVESFSPTVPPRLADNGVEIKDIEDVTCDRPVVTAEQLRLWAWMADYYLCNIGDVYKAAVPVRMRMESETVVELADDPEDGRSDLSDSERKIVEAVRALKECPLSRIVSATGLKSITSRISSLIDKGVLVIKEELRQSYKPKYETRVRLSDKYADERALNELFGQLGGKRQQLNMLMKYVELSKAYAGIPQREVSKKEMEQAAGFSESALKTLRDKGIMEVYKAETGRLATGHAATVPLHELTEAQSEAYCAIKDAFARKNVCLLHGVTSSGKTEIYIRLIQDALNKGMQVLYMLPEIALTKQITERLERVFGDKLGIYHSKFPDNERVEIWRKQSGDAPYDIIVGVRSSVFLPFRRLGLVIVDEEHENTYKQYDPAPRYHARDTAVMFASMLGAKTLLGSATPSIESFCNARTGKYAYVRLATRFKDVELPQIEVVDTKELRRRKIMKGFFSPFLIGKIKDALAAHEQVILFQNRRGFAPMLECRTCGWVPRCINCDVSLTYHKSANRLTCHYCGYSLTPPDVCPACGDSGMRHVGIGTEFIEEEMKSLFPEARTARMDVDTTRTRNSYEKIINDFQQGKTDILIGTQMVSKGLDFDNVSVVGIVNADNMLNFPDFRSYERAFQLMEQVAGRAGRRNRQGLVIIQTGDPDNVVIKEVVAHDYEAMYESQCEERLMFKYPPFYRMVNVYLKHKDGLKISRMAEIMAGKMRQVFGARILGPDRPPVGKIQNYHIRKIVLKVEGRLPLAYVRQELRRIRAEMKADAECRSAVVYYDVDPM